MSYGIPRGMPALDGLWRTGPGTPRRSSVRGLAYQGMMVCLTLGWILSGCLPHPPSSTPAFGAQSACCLVLYTRGLSGRELAVTTGRLTALGVPIRLDTLGDRRANWLAPWLQTLAAATLVPPPVRGAALPFSPSRRAPRALPALERQARDKIG